MSFIQEEKKELRKKIKLAKAQLTEAELKARSEKIFARLESASVFQYASTVLCYWSIGGEVYTHDFIQRWHNKKNILLPCVQGDILVLKKFRGIDKLLTGEQFKIPEPEGPAYTDWEKTDLAIVPGVAFDSRNNRMGRGKAFYDRLLPGLSAFRIGLCFDFQFFENIPYNDHDIKMDLVIHD